LRHLDFARDVWQQVGRLSPRSATHAAVSVNGN
jgi:hypothetical protein